VLVIAVVRFSHSKGVVVVPDDERLQPAADAIRLDLVLEATGMAAWEWDLVTGGVRTSGDVETILGVAPGDLGRGWDAALGVIHADDRQAFAEWLEARRLGGPEASLDFRVPGPAGGVRWAVARGRCYRDDGGRPARVVGVVADVSERRRQQEEDGRSQRFLDSVIEHIPAMVFVKDAAELRFVLVNRGGEELLGSPGAELVGRNDHDFLPAEEADFSTAKDRAVLQRGEVLDIPVEPVHTRDRGTRLLHTKKIPICDDDGRPQFLLGISEDVTERVEAEAALAEARLETERGSRASRHTTGADPGAAAAPTRGQNGSRSRAGSTAGDGAGTGAEGAVTLVDGTGAVGSAGPTGAGGVLLSPPAKSRNTRRATMAAAPTAPRMTALRCSPESSARCSAPSRSDRRRALDHRIR
jgi:PAS domain S-box-containing protein